MESQSRCSCKHRFRQSANHNIHSDTDITDAQSCLALKLLYLFISLEQVRIYQFIANLQLSPKVKEFGNSVNIRRSYWQLYNVLLFDL